MLNPEPTQGLVGSAYLRPGDLVVRLYLDTLRAPASRDSMRASLVAVARLAVSAYEVECDPSDVGADRLDWRAMDFPQATALRALMMKRWAPATTNRHLAALRGVVRCAHMAGLMGSEQASRCRAALANVPARYEGVDPAGRLVTDRELREVFSALSADDSVISRRDAAMLALLGMGAMRRSELVALDLVDYLPSSGEILIRHGKGGKVRKVWVHSGGQEALDAWVEVRGEQPGPLLAAVRKGGLIVAGEEGRLSGHAVWKRLAWLTDRVGVEVFTPHDLRHKVVSDLLDDGVDIAAVQRLAGHASVSTTARYDRRGERAARKAAMRVTLPYVAPRGAPQGL